MQHCDHDGALRYARRRFKDGTVHLCVQCTRCLDVIKTERHGGKLFLKPHDIPPGALIFDWIDPTGVQGGLF